MGCKACEARRRKLAALKAKKQAKNQTVQAAAIGAVLAVSEAVGKAIHGEVEDGTGTLGSVEPDRSGDGTAR